MSHEPGTPSTIRTPIQARSAMAHLGRLLGAVIGVAVVVVGATASSAFAAGPTVDVATSSNFGPVLTNAQGFALYTFPSDHDGMSTCTGACVPVWPAVTVPAGTTPTAGTGVSGTVAAVLQSTGAYQVTYNGAPLYTFVGDTSPAEVSGNNVGGFKVVQVAASTPPSTAPPTSTPPPVATSAPTSTPPAATTPTTAPSRSAPTAAPVVAPAAAASSGSSSSAAGGAPASSAAAGTPSLAVTGPGPALTWMLIVGAGLTATSLSMLLVLGGRVRLRRATLARATRAGWWLLGR